MNTASRSAALAALSAVVLYGAASRADGFNQPSERVVVASVRLHDKTVGGMTLGWQPGGRFMMLNAPITTLIRAGFGGENPEIVGAPKWVREDRYDVILKVDRDTDGAGRAAIIRSLLVDRFKLNARVETRELPVLFLVTVEGSSRSGLEGPVTCGATRDRRVSTDGRVPPSVAESDVWTCGSWTDGGNIYSDGITMRHLAQMISGPALGRPVLDRTDLKGNYAFTLRFSSGIPTRDGSDPGPDLVTALREQLGLRLKRDRAPLQTIVVQSIERPTEN